MAKRLTDKKAAKLAAKSFKAWQMLRDVEAEILEYNPNFGGDLTECGIGFYHTDATAALAEALTIFHGQYRPWTATALMEDGTPNDEEA